MCKDSIFVTGLYKNYKPVIFVPVYLKEKIMNTNLFNDSNILTGENVSSEELFVDTSQPESTEETKSEETQPETKENNIPEGDVNAEDLFGSEEEQSPESVGNDEYKEEEEAKPKKEVGSSPKSTNLYSSFAQALYGDGLFQFLDKESVDNVNDADSFSAAFENEVNARLTETQKRIKEALDYGVQPNLINQYETTLNNLNNISEDSLTAETTEGENLRKILIKQDYLNKGFSQERAERQVERILSSGTDVEDAKDALESVKEFYQQKYNEQIANAKQEAENEKKRIQQEAEDLKKAILDKDNLFDDIPVDKRTRQKAFDAMTKIVKTNKDGEQLTAVQQYADENPVEFRTILGLMYAMTDGFSKMGNILKSSVNKKVKTNLQNIERSIYGENHHGGSFNFVEGEDLHSTGSFTGRKRLDI